MSCFSVTCKVNGISADFIVDTGAHYSVAPNLFLRGCGVVAEGQKVLRLANGQKIECEIGEGRLELRGETHTVPFAFAPAGSPLLLGAMALEIFGLVVDPVRQVLAAQDCLLV